jgi:hypothetical protein
VNFECNWCSIACVHNEFETSDGKAEYVSVAVKAVALELFCSTGARLIGCVSLLMQRVTSWKQLEIGS